MSALTSLARAQAALRGRAQPITTVRHVHVSRAPLVIVPLAMAGEANAPLAAMVGQDRGAPALLIVPQPRNRSQRFEFAHSLALIMLHYLGQFATTTEPVPTGPGRTAARRPTDAPQVWVPNGAGIEFLRLFGRSTRFRSTSGPYAVQVSVPILGKWLTFLAEQAEHPGSSLLLAATEMLAQHWATGQSAIEDANLAAALGWIDPPVGVTGREAARAADDPLQWPPAGPATDPTFDREVLAPSIAEYAATGEDVRARRRAVTRLTGALRSQLEPTWQLTWRAIELIGQLPPGGHVAARWEQDRHAYCRYYDYVAGGGNPQPKRDSAVAAAVRLNELERRQAAYEAQCAFDDPLVMAEHRLVGEAFVGTVVSSEPNRRVGAGRRRSLRPLITVHTTDPFRLTAGEAALSDPARPRQHAEIVAVTDTPLGSEIVLELAGGMGRGQMPIPGTVPAPGDLVCFSTVTDDYQPRGTFPARDATPWTHGGPPQPPARPDGEANEAWS